LDRVIGEFDDGLLSSTESESPVTRPAAAAKRPANRRNADHAFGDDHVFNAGHVFDDDDDESHIEAEIRRLPPPKGRRNERPAPQNRRNTLSDQVTKQTLRTQECFLNLFYLNLFFKFVLPFLFLIFFGGLYSI
jgi:hypothetical protein